MNIVKLAKEYGWETTNSEGFYFEHQDIEDFAQAVIENYKDRLVPVAWMSEEVLPLNHIIKAVVRREPDEQYTIPLYTHPKEWQGLSDDDISYTWAGFAPDAIDFARAIEAKLKEKNT